MNTRLQKRLHPAGAALLAGLLLIATGTQAAPAEDGWPEDLDYLVKTLKEVHPDPFFSVSRSSFDSKVESFKAALLDLSRAQRVVRLMQLVALIHDGHTTVDPLQAATGFRLLPVKIYPFSDGYYVIHTRQAEAGFLGARLVSVGDTPIETVAQGLASLIPHENDMTVLRAVPTLLLVPEILHALGYAKSPDAVDLTFEGHDGRSRSLRLEPVSVKTFSGMTWDSTPPGGAPLYRQQPEEAFWLSYTEDRQMLYVKYNAVRTENPSGETLSSFSRRIEKILAEKPVRQVVVDVRNNLGGDNTTYGPLLRVLGEVPRTKPQRRLSVIIGRATFSAAVNFVSELEQRTKAPLAGEPTGGKPNAYGDPRRIKLPHSGIEVRISTRYWQKSGPDDTRPWIAPDLPVPLSSADFLSGRDPVLEAILSGP